LNPEGKHRHTYSYIPFLGGKRICVGKTFVETEVKLVFSLFYQHFDVICVNEEDKHRKLSNNFMIIDKPKLMVKLIPKT
jgi:cytochrome P450